MSIPECGPTASISELKIRIMDLKIIMKQHSSALRLTGLHATQPLSKPRRRGSGPRGRAPLVSQAVIFLRPEEPEPGLPFCWRWGLGLGSLLQQAGTDERSWRMCLLHYCILCNGSSSLQSQFPADFCNSSLCKCHFTSDPN